MNNNDSKNLSRNESAGPQETAAGAELKVDLIDEMDEIAGLNKSIEDRNNEDAKLSKAKPYKS